MRKRTFITVASFICAGFLLSAQEAFQSEKLVKVWETPDGLNTPESACFNPADGIIYVSNIAQTTPDKVGYLSKRNANGSILVKEWVKGMNSPKGIAIVKDKLYVADPSMLWEIALKTGEVLKKYSCSFAKGLNDVASDANGTVYVMETKKNMILTLGKDSLEVFSASDQLGNLNGVCDFGTEMILGSKGKLLAINKKTKEIRVIAEKTGGVDGIVVVGKNKIITSNWWGLIQLIEIGKPIEKLMDTTPLKINAADLGYIASKKLLLVPTFSNNKVNAYKLKF